MRIPILTRALLTLAFLLTPIPLYASGRVPAGQLTSTHFIIEQAAEHATVLLAAHNASDSFVVVHISVLNEDGSQAAGQSKTVKPRATWTVNLHDWTLPYANGLFKGSAQVYTTGDVLIGDVIAVDASRNFSHANQLIPLLGSCQPTCNRLIVRYLDGGAFDGGTVFTVDRGNFLFAGNDFDVTLYDEAGNGDGGQTVHDKPANFDLDAADLHPSAPFGVAYFDFGHYSTELMATYRAVGRYSAEVEAWCDYCNPCNPEGQCYNPSAPGCGTLTSCGNHRVDPGETCANCPGDVGPCPRCGDGHVDPGEDCHTCPADVGVCPVCHPATLTLTAGSAVCTVGAPCTNTVTAGGDGLGPITNTTLPNGMTRTGTNPATVSGTPTNDPDYTFSVTGQCGTAIVPITVNPAPPTCEQQHPATFSGFTNTQGSSTLSGAITITSGPWSPGDFHIYATDSLAHCNARSYVWDKTHSSHSQGCGTESTTLNVTYGWGGHPATYWRFTLYNGSATTGNIKFESACIYNPHHGSITTQDNEGRLP